jgi:hypothetical protein
VKNLLAEAICFSVQNSVGIPVGFLKNSNTVCNISTGEIEKHEEGAEYNYWMFFNFSGPNFADFVGIHGK